MAVIVAITSSASFGADEPSIPILALDRATATIGRVKQGGAASATFVLKNRGTGPLVIADVFAPCLCTVVSKPSSIAAGSEDKLEIAVGTDVPGLISRSIYLASNDPVNPLSRLFVSAEVIPLVAATPSRFVEIRAFAGRGWSGTVVLTSEEPSFDPRVKSIADIEGTGFAQYVTATVEKASTAPSETASRTNSMDVPATSAKVVVTLADGAGSGDIDTAVTIETGLVHEPSVVLRLSGWVRPRLTVLPETVDWRLTAVKVPQRLVRTIVLVDNDTDSELGDLVTSTDGLPPGMSARTVRIEKGVYTVSLVAATPPKSGTYDGKVQISAGEGDNALQAIVPVHIVMP